MVSASNQDIKAAAEESLRGDTESVSIAQTLEWHRERASLLAAFVLSHPFGALKPLEWEVGPFNHLYASGIGGQSMCVHVTGVLYRLSFSSPFRKCDSIDHGKQLCEQHYASEIAKVFTTIGGDCGEG